MLAQIVFKQGIEGMEGGRWVIETTSPDLHGIVCKKNCCKKYKKKGKSHCKSCPKR